jgi:hypothetical protein
MFKNAQAVQNAAVVLDSLAEDLAEGAGLTDKALKKAHKSLHRVSAALKVMIQTVSPPPRSAHCAKPLHSVRVLLLLTSQVASKGTATTASKMGGTGASYAASRRRREADAVAAGSPPRASRRSDGQRLARADLAAGALKSLAAYEKGAKEEERARAPEGGPTKRPLSSPGKAETGRLKRAPAAVDGGGSNGGGGLVAVTLKSKARRSTKTKLKPREPVYMYIPKPQNGTEYSALEAVKILAKSDKYGPLANAMVKKNFVPCSYKRLAAIRQAYLKDGKPPGYVL